MIGVVVVHYGDPRTTAWCLKSVHDDPSPIRRRVVVVDNSGNYPAPEGQAETVLRLPHNPGFGAGANAGIAALGEEEFAALVILNHDVELLPGYLAAVSQALSEDGVGAVGGPLYLGRPGGPLWYAGGRVNFLLGTVSQSHCPRLARRARKVGFLPGAALAVAPQAWREVGGFDPAFFLYNEDLDLCLRLRRRGYSLRFVPQAAAVHQVGMATGSHRRSPFYLEHLSRTRLRPFRPLPYRLYLAALHSGYVMVRALALALTRRVGWKEQARALLRGHRAALREMWVVNEGEGTRRR